MRAHRAARLVVEVLGRQLGEDRHQARMCDDAGECATLAARLGVDPLRRERGLRRRTDARELQAHAEAVAGPADRLALLRRVGERPQERAHRLVAAPLGLDPCAVERIRLCGCEARLEPVRIVGGIDTWRQRDDVDVEALPDRRVHAAQRRGRARRVAVEREPEALRQPSELAQLRLGQRRPHARNDRLEACLAQRDHVGVPLDDAGAILLRDRFPRLVEPVDDSPLRKELRFGRVDVLAAQRVVVVQAPGLEPDHAAACVGEREKEPPLEVIVAALP